MTGVLRWLGYIQPSHLPVAELLKFVLFANFSIVGMNVSLMWNSVGFYQVTRCAQSFDSFVFSIPVKFLVFDPTEAILEVIYPLI